MARREGGQDNRKMVSASELAQMAVCEQRIVFERRFGKRSTAAEDTARVRGNAAHSQFHQEALAASARVRTSEDKRCFIATAAFGETASETAAFRQFRDLILRRSLLGRYAIRFYYWCSPGIAALLVRSPWAKSVAIGVLRPLASRIERILLGRAKGPRP